MNASKLVAAMAQVTCSDSLCGECQACCVTLYIDGPDFDPPKPSHQPCRHCSANGCCLHKSRRYPQVCRTFECWWLASQTTDEPMPPEMRPDRSGVILTGPEPGEPDDLFYVHPDITDQDACDRDPVRGFLRRVQAEGLRARLVTHYHGEVL